MVDTNKLKAKLKENGLTQAVVAGKMSIDPATFNRKINNSEGETLTVKEVEQLANILQIPREGLAEIFFTEKLA